MTKTEQLMEHLKDVALMFGYDIEGLEAGHVTHRPAQGETTEFDRVTLVMKTDNLSEKPVENVAKSSFGLLKPFYWDMISDFLAENNIVLMELPFTHPLRIIFLMFILAEEGATDDAFNMLESR
ncbi:MAG: hypothetical protein ACLRWM_10970 [Streptococcus sp.]